MPFLSSNTAANSLISLFLFRRFSEANNYTFFNISTEVNCLFFCSPLFFSLQRAVLNFSAHSERNSTALQIKLQCAGNVTTVR